MLRSLAWFILPTTPPFNLLFFRRIPPGFRQVSARFPPGSAGFRRVPPRCAGFRRVPPGSAVSCCAWFRQAGFCRVAANKVSALDSPSICVFSAAFPLVRLPLLLYAATFQPGFCHDCAKFLASVGQACGNQRRAVYEKS